MIVIYMIYFEPQMSPPLKSQFHAFHLQLPLALMVEDSLVRLSVCRRVQSLDVLLSFELLVLPALVNEGCVALDVSIGAGAPNCGKTDTVVHCHGLPGSER